MSEPSTAIVGHTPGPWTFVGSAIEADSPTRPGFTDVVGWVSADVDEIDGNANGYMMAAAPDLLASVKDLLDQHEQTCAIVRRGDICIVQREAYVAIAKAEGRDQ